MADNQELLYIETPKVSVTLKGPFVNSFHSNSESSDNVSSLQVVCKEEAHVTAYNTPVPDSIRTVGNEMIYVFSGAPLFYEQKKYELVIEPSKDSTDTITFDHDNLNIRKNVQPVNSRSRILSGVLDFGSEIGKSEFIVKVNGKRYLSFEIEVFPSKIGYKEDYQAIVADITAELYNLAFDCLKKTNTSFQSSNGVKSSPVEFFAIIRKVYKSFMKAADMILLNPHHVLYTEHEMMRGDKIHRTDRMTVQWLIKHPERVRKTDKGYYVEKAPGVKKYVTYDANENRLTKYMLERTARRLENFEEQYRNLYRESDEQVIEEIEGMIHGIRRRCNSGVLREIPAMPTESGMSLVFGMAPGYRELYKYYLMLRNGLSLTGDVFRISMKEMARLYEYWCFIKLNSLLKDKYLLKSQDIIKVQRNNLFVSLKKGAESKVEYVNPRNSEVITLRYNSAETETPTVSQKPDNVLSLVKNGTDVKYEYVFDAKYKIDTRDKDGYGNKLTPGPKEEDINTMHRYRDAIVSEQSLFPYERKMFGAYILFPYNNEEEYRKHKFYESIEKVNIGGLPFLPSATTLVEEFLDELINDSPDTAFERATLPVGIEERLNKSDWNNKDVLIGRVHNETEKKRFLYGNYYFTYKSDISEDKLPIHYVAIYEKNTGIEYFGVVRTVEERKRKELSGHGTRPNDTCYVFRVKEWKKLVHPIYSQDYGPSSVAYTNYFLLTHSSTYPELHLPNKEQYRFYTELKRITNEVLIEEENMVCEIKAGDCTIEFQNDSIKVMKDGECLITRSIDAFSKRPMVVFKELLKMWDWNSRS